MYIDHSYLFFVGGGYDGCDIYRDHQAKQARVEEKERRASVSGLGRGRPGQKS